jgi:FixJ family two-component response regulator
VNSRTTVFLIDDDHQMRESLKWLFESNGYRVVASASPAEAIRKYEPNCPGCLVLDVRLPDMTGVELYRRLREQGAKHPFVVITAYGGTRLAVEVMRLGAIDLLEKPFEHAQLLARVAEAVAQDRLRRQADKEAEAILSRLRVLGRREKEVADLVAEGRSSKQIAAVLDIKVKTVEVHRHNILKKLQVESAVELAALVTKARSFGYGKESRD